MCFFISKKKTPNSSWSESSLPVWWQNAGAYFTSESGKKLQKSFFLTELIRSDEDALKLAKSSKFIVPAASSLFSRLHGRCDLAWFLAKTLSRESGAKLISPPWFFHFSLKKRSLKTREGESFPLHSLMKEDPDKSKILLLDDVLTTGFTLEKLARQYEPHFSVRALTLAYARRLS